MDNFSLLRPKLPRLEKSRHPPTNISGDGGNFMHTQQENENWNERWEQQILEWEQEMRKHLLEAFAYAALIELAASQIKPEPPA